MVVPPATEAGCGVASAFVVGLPLIRRLVLAASCAGYGRVLVRDVPPGDRSPLEGTAASMLTPAGAVSPSSCQRVVSVPANVLPQPRWLRALLETPIEREKLYVDPSMVAIVETEQPGRVIAAAARSASAAELLDTLRGMFDEVALPVESGGRFPLTSLRDVPEAEAWLLRSLIKQNEGFMSRHFERRISLALTRRLAATSVTPNAMTLVSIAVGLAGAPCFLSASPAWQLAGALLFLAHSILDGCDGELARLKFLESRRGAAWDFWGDNLVHVAVFAAIAIGWSLRIGAAWPLGLGAVAVAASLSSAAAMFARTVEDRVVAAGGSPATRLVGALASRDFIYVVVVVSAFGKAGWFLAAAAVGAPAFLLLVLWLDRHDGRVR